MSSTTKRVLSISAIVLSSLVILLCAAGVVGVWSASGKIIAAGTKLITAAEKAAVAVRIGLESIDNGLGRLEEDTQTIEEATAQLSQNISDKGLILVLLPPAKEEKLTNTISAIDDALTGVEEMVSSLIDTLIFIDSIPFVEVPKPEPEVMSSLSAKVEKLNTSIEKVNSQMQQARDNSAGAAQRVSDAVGELNDDIEAARAELDSRSEQIAATAETLSGIKGSLSTWVYLGAFLVTLLLAWVIYTQVLIIQFSLAKYKAA
jgi:cytochrome c556